MGWSKLLIILLLLFPCCVFGQLEKIQPVFQTGHHGKINSLKFLPNNKHVLSCADDGKIVLWDVYLGLQRASVLAHAGGVNDFDFINDSVIISIGQDQQLSLWSIPNLTCIKKFDLNTKINAISTIDSTLVCLVGKRIYFFNLISKKIIETNCVAKKEFTSVDYNKVINELAVTGQQENYVSSIVLDNGLKYSGFMIDQAHSVKYSEQGLLCWINRKGNATYSNNNKQHTFTLNDEYNYVSDIAFSNKRIAMSTIHGNTIIIDNTNHNVICELGVNGYAINAIDFSDDNKWLVAGNVKGHIYLYDAENYTLNKMLKSASSAIVDVLINEDDIYIGYGNGVIRKINIRNNRVISNSIQVDKNEEKNGIQYSISSLDSLVNSELYFTAYKVDRHHVYLEKLYDIKSYSCKWKENGNTIVIKKEIKNLDVNQYVDDLYYSNSVFQLTDLIEKKSKIKVKNRIYEISQDLTHLYFIENNDTTFFSKNHNQTGLIGLNYILNKEVLVTYYIDGGIKFWTLDGTQLVTLYLSGQYDFTFFNLDGYYYASKASLNKIGFLTKNELSSFESYDLTYNRPDIVMRSLNFYSEFELKVLKLAHNKRLQLTGTKLLNQNEVIEMMNLNVNYFGDYSTKLTTANFLLSSNNNQNIIVSYSYIHNGIETVVNLNNSVDSLSVNVTIDLSPGINQIEFYCKEENGNRSIIKKEIITCEKRFKKPNLYLVTIGAGIYSDKTFNLDYAQKDAEDLNRLITKSKKYKKIIKTSLINEQVTRENFEKIYTFLSQANVNDVVMVFYAGHGVLNDKFDYFLGTYDINFSEPSINGIYFKNFESKIESLDCRNKLVLIDACHSGELDTTIINKSNSFKGENIEDINFRSAGTQISVNSDLNVGVLELSKLLFVDMRSSRGTTIISSASGTEYAIEGDEWKNGVFTYSLVNGLRKKAADSNNDGVVRIMELQSYLRNQVSNSSGGLQNPITRKENSKNNFVIW